MEPPDDAILIDRALQGDDAGYRGLVERYQGAVLGCCTAVTGSRTDGADAAQEAFIRFFRNLAQFDPRRPVRPYLLKIAGNCARDLMRSRRRLREHPEGVDVLDHVADGRSGPVRRIVRGERRQAVRDLVAGLPETLREVCSLFYLAECSCREVAEILEMSESAVKVALHRARRKLQHSGAAEWRTV